MALAYASPVLLVEDTHSLSMIYQKVLAGAGLQVECAFTMAGATQSYIAQQNRIVLLDLMLPDGDGLDLLRQIQETDSRAKVIVITANGSINRAVEAMREGAFDFLVKPFDDRRLLSAVEAAIEALQIETASPAGGAETSLQEAAFSGFVGSSSVMQTIYRMVKSISRSTATVFVTGESGTGKEVCAETIHKLSTRRDQAFIPLNCAAIPANLLESEVFGHLKGSFTGAVSDKIGAAVAADRGTLFLDEICEMDLKLQTKLLRFLQTSTVQPVGAVRPQRVDVRIICATNRDPAEEVRSGRFREDLFYRLHVVPIALPPLRDRGEDVIEIANRLLSRFAEEEGKAFTSISEPAKALMRRYPWPGNVRELQNVLRNAMVLHDGATLTSDMLSFAPQGTEITPTEAPQPAEVQMPPGPNWAPAEALRSLVGMSLAELEREFIEATIAECKGSIPRAARLLEVSPSTLYRKRDAWKDG
ncbi:MAG: sigma-54 dependent transcriptional regulator [Pseudomonadota bacterium]